jgi:hypothetical protein
VVATKSRVLQLLTSVPQPLLISSTFESFILKAEEAPQRYFSQIFIPYDLVILSSFHITPVQNHETYSSLPLHLVYLEASSEPNFETRIKTDVRPLGSTLPSPFPLFHICSLTLDSSSSHNQDGIANTIFDSAGYCSKISAA